MKKSEKTITEIEHLANVDLETIPVFSREHHLPNPISAVFAVISNKSLLRSVNTHKECYELFFCTEGSAIHIVNGVKQYVMKGSMALVRETDIHAFTDPMSKDFTIYNLLFDKDIFEDIKRYYGEQTLSYVENSSTASLLQISVENWGTIKSEMEKLVVGQNTEPEYANYVIRKFLGWVISSFFVFLEKEQSENRINNFDRILREMYKTENYVEGLPALYRLFCCCPEHVCREFRKRLNKAPSRVISEIRLAEAARMLTTSEDKIIDICNNVGFKSLSHFNHSFKDYYGKSPSEFRKQTRERR